MADNYELPTGDSTTQDSVSETGETAGDTTSTSDSATGTLGSSQSDEDNQLTEYLEDPVTKHPTQLLCDDGKYRFKASLIKKLLMVQKDLKTACEESEDCQDTQIVRRRA